jgi:uncharacterized protein
MGLALAQDRRALLPNLATFARALRTLGLPITHERLLTFLAALEQVDLEDRDEVKNSARATLVAQPEHFALLDQVFDLFFAKDSFRRAPPLELGQLLRRRIGGLPTSAAAATESNAAAEAEADLIDRRFAASDRELLRRKDFAKMGAEELRAVSAFLRQAIFKLPPRPTRRRRLDPNGRSLDLRTLLRKNLRHGGELLDLPLRRWKPAARPIVALCDVSGSMEAYARVLLQFLFCLRSSTERLEVFAFATRLTRLTRELEQKDPNLALRAAVAKIVDWGGGTRIGATLRRFNLDWSRRVLGRGAVVLILSDAWERGEPDRLAAEVERLRANAHRLIWLNPLVGSENFAPLASGIRAVLPFVDDHLPVHNLHSLEQLAARLAELR